MHQYPVTVEWKGGRTGAGSIKADRSGVGGPLSVPTEFGGPGTGTNPEELLANAVAGCYSITFGIISEMRKLPVMSITTQAIGEVEENGPQFTYRKVILRPTIVLESSATDDQVELAEQMAHKADSYCIITNAIRNSVAIEVEPNIQRA